MHQQELFDIPNPCRGICEMDNKGYCKGCFRTRQERFSWNTFNNIEKRLILTRCRQRRLIKIRELKRQQQALIVQNTPSSTQIDLFPHQSS